MGNREVSFKNLEQYLTGVYQTEIIIIRAITVSKGNLQLNRRRIRTDFNESDTCNRRSNNFNILSKSHGCKME